MSWDIRAGAFKEVKVVANLKWKAQGLSGLIQGLATTSTATAGQIDGSITAIVGTRNHDEFNNVALNSNLT